MRGMDGYRHGVNLGGWLSQAEETTPEHYASFITEADIRKIAGWGLDHVRLPVDYTLLETEDGEPKEEGFHLIDSCLAWCRKYGLSLIIDLHKTYGYSFDPLEKDDKTRFFSDIVLQQRFYALWQRLAERYGKEENTAFELLNEIVSPEVKDLWNEIALEAIRRIREISDNWIIFGGVYYNGVAAVPWLPRITDRKVAYTFHCYEPLIFTHQGAYWVERMPSDFRIDWPLSGDNYREAAGILDPDLAASVDLSDEKVLDASFFERIFAPALETAEERDIPLYCGEYGVIDLADKEALLRWLKDIHDAFEKYEIGRALWNYREKDFGIRDLSPELCEKIVKLL